MRRRILFSTIALVLLTLVITGLFLSLQSRSSAGGLSGRILVWHSYSETSLGPITSVIETFTGLHPDVIVKQKVYTDPEEMKFEFLNAVDSGLGPDLLIGPADWLRPLASADAIQPISALVADEVAGRFMPAAIKMVTFDEQLWGLPESLDTQVLYYDAHTVSAPPATLQALLAEATAGNSVMIPLGFRDAYWGVPAFGGQLLDPDNRVILDQGGFANWLNWLQNARDNPGIILDANRNLLRTRFLEGEATYFVGYASGLNSLVNALGAESLGVAPLPAGPTGSAAPYLRVNTLMFSAISSSNQTRVALDLARFITNVEQSSYLMRTAGHIPANSAVRVNPRLHPKIAAVLIQARSSVPVPNLLEMETVFRLGTEAYTRVLEGLSTPAEVADEITRAINTENGFSPSQESVSACAGLGTIRLMHHLKPQEMDVLDTLIQRFRRECPLIIVEAIQVEFGDTSPESLADHIAEIQPALILADQTQVQPLLGQDFPLVPVGSVVAGEKLQAFRPIALESLRVDNTLIGLPLAIDTNVLYYHRDLVDEPVQVVDELLLQSSQGVPISIDITWDRAFWGIGAFGGQIPEDNGRIVIDHGGLRDWLAWLRAAPDSGIRLSSDSDNLREQFTDGRSAYYVAGPTEADFLRTALGEDRLGVTQLPSGPAGNAAPLLTTWGLFFPTNPSEVSTNLALEFARFLTNGESQAYLANAFPVIPANTATDVSAIADMAVFIEALRNSIPLHMADRDQVLTGFLQQVFPLVMDEDAEIDPSLSILAKEFELEHDFIPQAEGVETQTTVTTTSTTNTQLPTAQTTPAVGSNDSSPGEVPTTPGTE